jgi:hypothetical protein
MRTFVQAIAVTVLWLALFGGGIFGLLLYLDYVTSQPYCPDRVIEATSPEVSC